VDGTEAFGPCAAEELHEDGFGLVVESVSGEDAIGLAVGEEGREEVVAEIAGGLFDGLGVSGCAGFGAAGGDAGLMDVKGDVEARAEVFDEALVGIGFCAAKAVVDVNGREADAEGFAGGCVGGMEGEEESDGVCASGEGDAEAVAGLDVGSVEGGIRGGHLNHVSCCGAE
jgi:hypothetical protein